MKTKGDAVEALAQVTGYPRSLCRAALQLNNWHPQTALRALMWELLDIETWVFSLFSF